MIKGINSNCCDGYDNVNMIVKYSDNKNNRESSKSSKCRVWWKLIPQKQLINRKKLKKMVKRNLGKNFRKKKKSKLRQ